MKSLEAEHDMTISIAEIRKKSMEEYEQAAAGVFDALISRHTGSAFRNLLIGQAETIGRKAFVNFAGLAYDGLQKLGMGDLIKGQTTVDAQGNPHLTGIGKVLAGGPFGTNQAKLAAQGVRGSGTDRLATDTEVNTTATDNNTRAIDNLTARIGSILGGRGSGGFLTAIHSIGGVSLGGSSVGAYGAGALGTSDSSITYETEGDGAGGYSLPSSGWDFSPSQYDAGDRAQGALWSGGTASSYDLSDPNADLPLNGSPQSGQMRMPSTGPLSGSIEGPLFDPNASAGARAGSGVATAGALIGGTMAAYQGFKKGGGQGSLQGISSVAGTAALLDPEPVSKAILAGVAVVTGAVAAIMGDPKANFAKQQQLDLQANQYFAPQQLSVNSDTGGNLTSYGFKGNVRSSTYDANSFTVSAAHYDNVDNYSGPKYTIPGSATPNYGPGTTVINASFVDPAGLAEHANNLASAVDIAMKGGHPINDTIGQLGH